MKASDILKKKRDGEPLSSGEISWLIQNYTNGKLPDYQMSAFLMAVYFNGMTSTELSFFTKEMIQTGRKIDLSSIAGIKVDKHSTGGVGDKVTLVLAPLVASFGVPVAKMSGRGLGHTGGTIDKLESIKGYHVERTEAEFIRQIQDIGLAIISQSDDLVRADKLLYALRDVTATVDSIPLIASSIMSKKIASGADKILLDVTVGQGAFMKTRVEAEKLANKMISLGSEMGKEVVVVLTNMDQPLGYSIGNRLEILEALDLLEGKGHKDTKLFICQLAQLLLEMAGKKESIKHIEQHLSSGKALEKFEQLVLAQGGDLNDLYRPIQTRYQSTIYADRSGYITDIPALVMGELAMSLGAGRRVKTDIIDHESGIVFTKKVGDFVEKGEKVATLYSNLTISKKMVTICQKNVKIGNEKTERKDLIKIIKS